MTDEVKITAEVIITIPLTYAGRASAYSAASMVDAAFEEFAASWTQRHGGDQDSVMKITISRDMGSEASAQPPAPIVPKLETRGRRLGSKNREKANAEGPHQKIEGYYRLLGWLDRVVNADDTGNFINFSASHIARSTEIPEEYLYAVLDNLAADKIIVFSSAEMNDSTDLAHRILFRDVMINILRPAGSEEDVDNSSDKEAA